MRATLTSVLFAQLLVTEPLCAQVSVDLLLPGETMREASPHDCPQNDADRLAVRCWVGQSFLILPKDGQREYPEIEGFAPYYHRPSYDDLAGKTVTVVKVHWLEYTVAPSSNHWVVTFRVGEKGPFYTVNSVQGGDRNNAVVPDLALLRDLQRAQALYKGRSFWLKTTTLPLFDETRSTVSQQMVSYRRFEPMTVVSVLESSSTQAPIRFVIKNESGQPGYFDGFLSPTNRDEATGDAQLPVDQLLTDVDPKAGHNWPAAMWDTIETAGVEKGMTTEEVQLSWGEPLDISRGAILGHERQQWSYGGSRYVNFLDGVVVSKNDK